MYIIKKEKELEIMKKKKKDGGYDINWYDKYDNRLLDLQKYKSKEEEKYPINLYKEKKPIWKYIKIKMEKSI